MTTDVNDELTKRLRVLRGYRTNVEEFHSRCYVESKLIAEEIGSVEEQTRTVQRQKHRANNLRPKEELSLHELVTRTRMYVISIIFNGKTINKCHDVISIHRHGTHVADKMI